MLNPKDLTDNWYSDNANRPALAAILNQPVMQQVLRILFAVAAAPTNPPPLACDIVQFGAMIGYTRNGAFDILRALEALAEPQKVRPTQAPPFDQEAQKKFIPTRSAD